MSKAMSKLVTMSEVVRDQILEKSKISKSPRTSRTLDMKHQSVVIGRLD